MSFWPDGIDEDEAENQELIVHVHFDAKYKVANFLEVINESTDEQLDEEKVEQKKGVYKNADLLKMHAYKDAIRRTGGAYVLYPGKEPLNRKGFHEIIPGLGAFPVKPSKTDDGTKELKIFINEIISHFLNRVSQREKMAFRTYNIYKNPPSDENIINEPLPETLGENRGLIPDETFVLVGYYNSAEQYEWIKRAKLYNFRMGSGKGSLILDKETVSSKYLLLHTLGDSKSADLWKIVSKGPKVYTRQNLEQKGYPKATKTKDYNKNYLVVSIEKVIDSEFEQLSWNFKNLENYSSNRASAIPFITNLTELMKNINR